MKWMALIVLVLGFEAFASRVEVMGAGYQSGYCRGDFTAQMCKSQLEYQAQAAAERNADLDCRLKQGTLLSYTRFCMNTCNPPFIQPGMDVYMSCQAQCRYTCDVRD